MTPKTASAEKATVPRHFNHLRDARTIKTEPFLMTQRAVRDCAKFASLGVVVGDAGQGKTFAVDAALGAVRDPIVKTLFSHQATPREVARQLVEAATGEQRDGTRFQLTDYCVDVFRERYVAVIDEAQHLNRDCTFFLRYLLDHPETNVSIVLIGGNGCWERIARDPMLRSRVYRRVAFAPVPINVLLKSLSKYHPLYADVSDELILEVNDQCDLTQLRTLAIFTHTVVELCAEMGEKGLNEQIATRALVMMGEDAEF